MDDDGVSTIQPVTGDEDWIDEDGRRLLELDHAEIVQRNVISGDEVSHTSTQGGVSEWDPDWSANGVLAFVRTSNAYIDADLYTRFRTGSALKRRTDDARVESDPTWGPRSRRIAYVSAVPASYELRVLDVASGEITIAHGSSNPIASPSWSPDGQVIWFTEAVNGTWRVRAYIASTGTTTTLSYHDGARSVAAAPDYRHFATITEGPSSTLSLRVGGIAAPDQFVQLREFATIAGMSWSHDGRKLAVGAVRSPGDNPGIAILENATVNEPPNLTAVPNQHVDVGDDAEFTVSATDPDDQEYLRGYFLPSGASFTGATGAFSWTPTEPGIHLMQFIAYDHRLGVDRDWVGVTVGNPGSSGGGGCPIVWSDVDAGQPLNNILRHSPYTIPPRDDADSFVLPPDFDVSRVLVREDADNVSRLDHASVLAFDHDGRREIVEALDGTLALVELTGSEPVFSGQVPVDGESGHELEVMLGSTDVLARAAGIGVLFIVFQKLPIVDCDPINSDCLPDRPTRSEGEPSFVERGGIVVFEEGVGSGSNEIGRLLPRMNPTKVFVPLSSPERSLRLVWGAAHGLLGGVVGVRHPMTEAERMDLARASITNAKGVTRLVTNEVALRDSAWAELDPGDALLLEFADSPGRLPAAASSTVTYVLESSGRYTNPRIVDVGEAEAYVGPSRWALRVLSGAGRSVAFELSVPREGRVSAQVFDSGGRLVSTLLDGPVGTGYRKLTLNGDDVAGSGVYFLRVKSAGFRQSRKFVLLQ